MTRERLELIVARLGDARHRYAMARRQGDSAGAAYAKAEARRLAAILEGAGL
jgi:hypothetical protein